ncbi:MAG: hypothetical protein P9E67_03320 [Candidatus Competibacter sp.]|nr:hypothetical protein [Candidatus Competibacter sp.]
MADIDLGTVKTRKGNGYKVSWNESSCIVYVRRMAALFSTWERCGGRAKTAREAMAVAEAYIWNRD